MTAAIQGQKKSHHFIPQFYLRGFLDPDQVAAGQNVLWVYRPGSKPKPKGTKAVACEDFFYDATDLPAEVGSIEDKLAQIEAIAAPTFQKLRSGEIRLTDQEKGELAMFVALMLSRTQSSREQTNTITAQFMRLRDKRALDVPGEIERIVAEVERTTGEKLDVSAVREAFRLVVEGHIHVTQSSKAWNIKQMFERAYEFGDLFERMRWELLEAPLGEAFITSDSPVRIFDPAAVARGPKEFQFTEGLQLQCPISSRFLLVGSFGPGQDRREQIPADWVRRFNWNQMAHASGQIYAALKSEKLQSEFDCVVNVRPPVIPRLPDDFLEGS